MRRPPQHLRPNERHIGGNATKQTMPRPRRPRCSVPPHRPAVRKRRVFAPIHCTRRRTTPQNYAMLRASQLPPRYAAAAATCTPTIDPAAARETTLFVAAVGARDATAFSSHPVSPIFKEVAEAAPQLEVRRGAAETDLGTRTSAPNHATSTTETPHADLPHTLPRQVRVVPRTTCRAPVDDDSAGERGFRGGRGGVSSGGGHTSHALRDDVVCRRDNLEHTVRRATRGAPGQHS